MGQLTLGFCVSPMTVMLEASIEASWYLWGHLRVPQPVALECAECPHEGVCLI